MTAPKPVAKAVVTTIRTTKRMTLPPFTSDESVSHSFLRNGKIGRYQNCPDLLRSPDCCHPAGRFITCFSAETMWLSVLFCCKRALDHPAFHRAVRTCA